MKINWENLAESLRNEIAEFGGLLNLFEQQQRLLFARDADAVLRLSAAIEAQVAMLHDARSRREQASDVFAQAHGHPAGATLRSMLPSVEENGRPLVEALVAEVNHLVHRTRRVTRHNHILLARAVETHEEFLRVIRPDAFNQTYAANGRVSPAAVRPQPALQAAG